MSEENLEPIKPAEPTESVEPTAVTPVVPEKKKVIRKKQATKIDCLPKDIHEVMDALILEGYGVGSVLSLLKSKFPTQTTLLPDFQALTTYVKNNIERLRTEREVGTNMATIVKETTMDLQTLSTAMTSSTLKLDDRKAVYENLFARMEKRLTYLEQKSMTGNFFDRDMEAAMGMWHRQMTQVTDSLGKLSENVNMDLRAEFAQDLDAYSRILFTIVARCAKEVYGDDKFSQFYAMTVDQHARAIRDFKTAKEQLLKGA